MRKVIAIVLIATILITAIVGSVTARLLPNDRQGYESEHTATQPTAPSSSDSESGRPESVEPAYLNPVLYPVLDLDYDDSWVANIPEFIDGYRVLHVDTPKSAACSDWPLIIFHATQKSLDEYLAATPEHSLVESSRPGYPGGTVGCSSELMPARGLTNQASPLTGKNPASKEKSRNENIARIGCQDHRVILGGRPISWPGHQRYPRR